MRTVFLHILLLLIILFLLILRSVDIEDEIFSLPLYEFEVVSNQYAALSQFPLNPDKMSGMFLYYNCIRP